MIPRFSPAIVLAACAAPVFAAVPRDFAVDVKATVKDTVPHISLSWTQRLQANITAQEIHRRLKGGTTWVKLADLGTSQTSYDDATALPGIEYEYWMRRIFTGFTPNVAMGYLSAGVKVPETEARGVLLLVIDDTMVTPLAGEIEQLKLDLAGDGWEVRQITAARSGTAAGVKAQIVAAYNADAANVKAVYLLGRVPVPYSGNQAPDGHGDHVGAWPADGYYGEMNGNWTDTLVNSTAASRAQNDNVPGDGKFDQISFPSLVELQVGRVDMSALNRSPASGGTELSRLRGYLARAHDFRHKRGAYAAIPRRTLIRDGFGHAFTSEPFAVAGWAGAFASVGGTVDEPLFGQWFSATYAGGKDYLWGHGCGGGSYDSASSLGYSWEFGKKTSRVVFTSVFGSYHGDWDSENNLMRSIIAGNGAGDSLGLCCFWSGRPNWFPHHPGMGETLGYMARVSMNGALGGGGGYLPGGSSYGGVHIGLMGDPALRLHMVEPPRGLAATSAAGQVTLGWAVSTETAVEGYHVYRGTAAAGPFTKLTAVPVTGTTYTDATAATGESYLYLVRTMKLESVPGGSYYNLSTGSPVRITVNGGADAAPASPSDLAVDSRIGAVPVPLVWRDNSDDETGFRVERKTSASGTYAPVASLPAGTTGYQDPGPFAAGNVYFYRVVATGAAADSAPSAEELFDARAGFVEFAVNRLKVNKTTGTASVTINRVGGETGAVSVTCATSNFSAIAGTHYTATTGTVTWADGEQGAKTFTFPVTNTPQPQFPRQVRLTLSAPAGGVALALWTTMAVLIEDTSATLAAPWASGLIGNVTDSSPGVSAEGGIGDTLMGGAGAVSGSTTEAGRFIQQTRTGDGVLTVEVPTPIVAQQTARFAAMVRATTTNNAIMAATVNASAAANFGSKIVYRTATGAAAVAAPATDNDLDTPRWLRITRFGNEFISESSPDGIAWAELGRITLASMPASAVWGIFHFAADLNASTGLADYHLANYRNVSLTALPVPAAPPGLAVGAVAAGSVPLTWTATALTSGYRIERRGDDGSVRTIATIGSGTTTAFTDTTARAGTAYEYRIAATNSGGEGPLGAPVRTITPPAGEIRRPGFLTAVPAGGGIGLAWADLTTGETGFELERRAAHGGWMPLASLLANTTSATDPAPLPGVLYHYRIRSLAPAPSSWAVPFSLLHDGSVQPTGMARSADGMAVIAEPAAGGFVPVSFRYSGGLVPFASGHPMTTTRNDASGWFGTEFTTGASAVEIRELGRWVLAGNSASHAVKLRDAIDGVDLGSVTIATAGAPAGAFKYAALAAPVTLPADRRYFILSEETAGGDFWHDPAVTAPGEASGYRRWLLAHGLPMDESGSGGASATPASDALPNLIKYALGLPAAGQGHGGRLGYGKMSESGAEYLTFRYVRPEPAPVDVDYLVEASGDLGSTGWDAGATIPVSTVPEGGFATVTVRHTAPMTPGGRAFLRLKVSRR